MGLLKTIESDRAEIEYILENFGFKNYQELLEFGNLALEPMDGERSGRARSGERDWAQSLDKTFKSDSNPNVDRLLKHSSLSGPKRGDLVYLNGKVMLKLGEPEPNGDFKTIRVPTGKPGMSMMPRTIETGYMSRKGKDGGQLWVPKK